MGKRRWLRALLRVVSLCLALALLFVWDTNRAVLSGTIGRIETETGRLPHVGFGLVLGTAPTLDGEPNLFFWTRMDAAARLYESGRVQSLLLSGDASTPGYDEPNAMKEALIKLGVPEQNLVVDFAGLRTLDSILRAKRVFGIDRCIIVTDDFHLPRALFIAQLEGLQATGFEPTPLPRSVSRATYAREILARTRVWIDMKLLRLGPKFEN